MAGKRKNSLFIDYYEIEWEKEFSIKFKEATE
jgi:hypothetical protein